MKIALCFRFAQTLLKLVSLVSWGKFFKVLGVFKSDYEFASLIRFFFRFAHNANANSSHPFGML